jgi:hypothetical protein
MYWGDWQNQFPYFPVVANNTDVRQPVFGTENCENGFDPELYGRRHDETGFEQKTRGRVNRWAGRARVSGVGRKRFPAKKTNG